MLRKFTLLLLLMRPVYCSGQEDLDAGYIGLEFKDAVDSVQIAWVDPEAKWARKILVGDVVLGVSGIEYNDAATLVDSLNMLEPETPLRFEVIGANDKDARSVPIRVEKLRDTISRRFTKERSRETREVLYVPKLPTNRFRIAVVESGPKREPGLRVRYYPNDRYAVPGNILVFQERSTTTLPSEEFRIQTLPTEFRYSNLTDADIKKLPTLTPGQLGSVRQKAYLDIGPLHTADLVRILSQPEERWRFVTYAWNNRPAFGHYRLNENELRNVRSCLLRYRFSRDGRNAGEFASE